MMHDATWHFESIGRVIFESSTPNRNQCSLIPFGISLRKVYISGKLKSVPFQNIYFCRVIPNTFWVTLYSWGQPPDLGVDYESEGAQKSSWFYWSTYSFIGPRNAQISSLINAENWIWPPDYSTYLSKYYNSQIGLILLVSMIMWNNTWIMVTNFAFLFSISWCRVFSVSVVCCGGGWSRIWSCDL